VAATRVKVKSHKVAGMLRREGRIKWLKERITAYQKELNKIENECLAAFNTMTGGQLAELRKVKSEVKYTEE